MKKTLSILISITILISCSNEKKVKNIKNSTAHKAIVGFSITSKNASKKIKSGTEVSLNEMTTKDIFSGEEVLFKSKKFTLNNEIDGALNFYSEQGILTCVVPEKISLMNMPPSGDGSNTYLKGSKVVISEISLIKIDSLSFVISNIRFKETKQ